MICYGIDIGTTTIRMIVSEVTFSSGRERIVSLLSKKPLCEYTPFNSTLSLNIPAVLQTIKAYVELEQFPPPDTGTILYTGEAQRSTNLSECTKILNSLWPNLLSAQLSPEVESRLAAYGAGAIEYSKLHPGVPIIHLDIGGGTTNLARIENGEIIDTACLDLGCRKWILDPSTLQVLHRGHSAEILEKELFPNLHPIQVFNLEIAKTITAHIADLLMKYCETVNVSHFPFVVVPWSRPTATNPKVIFFLSGGVADCPSIESATPFCFGDLGPLLLNSLKTKLHSENQQLLIAPSTGRATVLGISAHSFQLAGSSIYCSAGFRFPARNMRLIEENEFQISKMDQGISSLAIYVRSINEPSLKNIESRVKRLTAILSQLQFKSPFNIAFVLQKNIAQSFGYLFQKQLPAQVKIEFCVLDEITHPTKNIGLQLLDLSRDSETKRILVRILEFTRF